MCVPPGKLQREQMIIQERLTREQEAARLKLLNKASTTISSYMYRYKLRMYYYRLWRKRVNTESAGTVPVRFAIRLSTLTVVLAAVTQIGMIQRLYRGWKGRLKAMRRAVERAEFLACAPYGIMIQRNVRAYLCRLHNPQVSKAIREMYVIRRVEAHNAVAVSIQAQVRRHLASHLVSSWKELCARRERNVNDAILVMQMLARRFVSIMRVDKLRMQRDNYNAARRAAGRKIKTFCVEGKHNVIFRCASEH